MKISKLIRALRINRGLSQQRLAALTGIDDRRISQWECGHGSPKLLSCEKLARAFGMTLDEFADMVQANEMDATRANVIRPPYKEHHPIGEYRCSVCGVYFVGDTVETNYCGNCGAKLKEAKS